MAMDPTTMQANDEPVGTVDGLRVITDPEESARLAEEAAEANERFRRWARTGSRLSADEFDGLVARTADDVWRHIDCVKCARCCRMLWICLNRDDIARLASHLGMRTAAFEARYVGVSDGERGMDSPCAFLNGVACVVYADRPRACRGFPFLHTPGVRRRMADLVSNATLCPIIYNTLELLKRRLGWEDDVVPSPREDAAGV